MRDPIGSLFCTRATNCSTVFQMSLPALQVDASQFQRKKALKTELVQVTSTNSPLNPFSKIPHEREMSLAKKLV